MSFQIKQKASEIISLPSADSVGKKIKENWLSYAFLVPLLIYMIALVWIPAIQGLRTSFYNWPLFGQREFIGLDNYIYLLNWETFYISVKATLLYGLQTIPQLVFGVMMAMIVWGVDSDRVAALVSAIFLLPYVIPPIITGGIFRFLLHPNVGPIFKILVNAGVLEQPIYWMSDGTAAMAVISAVGVWTWTPFIFLLVLASLRGIPEKYYEVAEIYGAGLWEQFRYITLPQIKSTIILALILRIIWNLGKVTQPLQITRGGPGFETSVLGILLYRIAWTRSQFGLAFTVGVFLALIAISIIVLLVREYEMEGGDVRI